MKLLVITLAVLAVVAAEVTDEHKAAWKNFKTVFGKLFLSKNKETERMNNFVENYEHVQDINDAYKKGESTYKCELYPHSDLTREQFLKRKGGCNVANHTAATRITLPVSRSLPANFDLRHIKALNPIKNQGDCGSCWTFSTTCSMESSSFMNSKKKSIPTLSEQQLVDCVYDRDGCEGGFMTDGFKWIQDNGGQATPNEYGVYSGVYSSCNAMKGATNVVTFNQIENDPAQIKTALKKDGALAVAVDATAWGHYSTGVFSTTEYGNLNHAVNLVGWGVCPKTKKTFWTIRNSWGTEWGESGYIRVATDETGTYDTEMTFSVTAK